MKICRATSDFHYSFDDDSNFNHDDDDDEDDEANETFVSTNWTLEGGYSTNSFNTYPHRVFGPGEKFGLDISFYILKYMRVDGDHSDQSEFAVGLA